MACSHATEKHCRQLVHNQPGVIVQNGRKRHYYNGKIEHHNLAEFLRLLVDADGKISEKKIEAEQKSRANLNSSIAKIRKRRAIIKFKSSKKAKNVEQSKSSKKINYKSYDNFISIPAKKS